MTPNLRRGRTGGDIAAVLDVGSSTVTCLVAVRDSAIPPPVDDVQNAGMTNDETRNRKQL